MVMMFIDESVCSRVLGDEVFGYFYISCLNVTCVQMSLYISSGDTINTGPGTRGPGTQGPRFLRAVLHRSSYQCMPVLLA